MTYWDYPHIGTLTFLLFRWDLGARVYLRGRTLCAAVSCRPCPSVATGFRSRYPCHMYYLGSAGHVLGRVQTHTLATPHIICQCRNAEKKRVFTCQSIGAEV